jgi:type II secretory pathway pseudopilin PulG
MTREATMTARQRERGVTLPMTVLVIAIMGVAVAITYARLSSERRITSDGQAQVDAFSVAQSGLSTYLSNLNSKPVNPGPWGANYNVAGGTARVDMVMLRDSTSTLLPAVYVITSRGTATGGKRYDARTPPAERTVAAYALWTPAPLDMDAAITSLGGMDKAGGSGTMNGVDACGVKPPIPGVAVTAGAGVNGTSYTGAASPIDGNPDDTPVNLGTAGPAGTAKDEVDIDWAGIVAWPNTSMMPDLVYNGANWPASFTNWPVIRINNNPGGDFEPPSSGKGILIVTGNMTLSGSTTWEGLILVGGYLRSNGNNTVRGAVISGLNVKLGQAVGASQMNGSKSYQYDSCALTRALGHIGSIQRVRNGWTDTWSSY